ncbi:ESF2 [Candida jiufengensis]|uniref:ESF2 n=1 Tax=Candida jiufengensis TaxID=497108 RepID=UPI002223F6BA|nr:ESF2 [Candida jiufengensis]KAI5956301.1 ESF2 [Candida jiufengensis]
MGKLGSQVDSDFYSDEEEEDAKVFPFKAKAFTFKSDEQENDISDEDDMKDNFDREVEKGFEDNNNDSEDDDVLSTEEYDEDLSLNESNLLVNKKLKKLTTKELEKEKKRIKKTGVCYLSKIPPYMKPSKLRSILTRFGKIDRLFLKPEDSSVYHKRVKYGGNKKKKFTEGWIEFVNKYDAKLCASTLNGSKLGGKKGSYYYDDIINIKYLKNFKWMDLTQQISKENEIRESKLALEISQQNKYNKAFINNVEQAKLIKNIQKKRKSNDEKEEGHNNQDDNELRRSFKQRKVESKRSEAPEEIKTKSTSKSKLSSVLSKVL